MCPEERKCFRINEVTSEGHRILPEGIPTGHVWGNLNIKKKMTVMDYNPLKFSEKVHESIITLKKGRLKRKDSI